MKRTVKSSKRAFQEYYLDEFLKNIDVGMESTKLWLASITRKHRKSFHPYYHILLLNFLGLEVNEVFRKTPLEVEPFGKPKWPCLNIVCPNYKKDVIQEVRLEAVRERNSLLISFLVNIVILPILEKVKSRME
ncbi:TnsD family Tn7-like transposition protein [Oceanobacillus sp. 1P07AA]